METYSYYLDLLGINLYDFTDKERSLKDYVLYMLMRTQRIFKYTGLPDTIPQRMLEYQLQTHGFSCITRVGENLYAFYGGLGGEPDVYYRPTICVVANPALKFNKTLKIDEDCVIVRGDSYLRGLLPMFRRYATAMVENDLSFKLATINTRIQAWVTAPDDETKAAGDKFLEDIENGELGVIASNEFLDGLKTQPVQGSMRTFTDLIEYQQYLKASWYNEIGLNANYNMKREKLSTTESQMNNDALLPLVDDMLEQRRIGVEAINAMFGTNITVEFDSSWQKLLKEFQESNQVDGGEMNETGNDGEDTPSGDAGSVSDDGSTDSDGRREEVGGTDNEVSDSGEKLRKDSPVSGDEPSRTGDESERELGESSEESESTQLDSGEVEVNVDVTLNVGGDTSEREEDDSDRSIREDTDESGSDE